MIGDGMGPEHIKAAHIYKGGDLYMEKLPYIGSLGTDSRDGLTDSAAAATALATGHKTRNGYISVDRNLNELSTYFDAAKALGKKTGVVTSDFLCGATPSCFSGHAENRNDYATIVSKQLTGGVDLLYGCNMVDSGGNYYFGAESSLQAGYTFIDSESDLPSLEPSKGVVGAFSSIEPTTQEGATTLQALTTSALDYLSHDGNGFALMVEGAKIDKRSHANDFDGMVEQLMAFDECVKIVMNWIAEHGDAALIVTADHETGGLVVPDEADPAVLSSKISWSTSGHTQTMVPVYSNGKSYVFNDRMDNTDIYKTIYEWLD